jgi:hypothetical protein
MAFVQLERSSRTGKARQKKVGQPSPHIFPYCLRSFGPAQTCLHERMIAVNWWWNLDLVEQGAKTAEFATKLVEEPGVSKMLRNKYDPSKPKAIGVFDTPDLRSRRIRVEDIFESYSMEERNGKRYRMLQRLMHSCETKPFAVLTRDPRRANVKKMIFRSRITDENAPNISTYYESALTLVSSAYTPDKHGTARTKARRTAKLSIFSRGCPGLVA